MKEVKQEKIEKADNYYRVMREEKFLGRFIRLIDVIFVESGSATPGKQERNHFLQKLFAEAWNL